LYCCTSVNPSDDQEEVVGDNNEYSACYLMAAVRMEYLCGGASSSSLSIMESVTVPKRKRTHGYSEEMPLVIHGLPMKEKEKNSTLIIHCGTCGRLAGDLALTTLPTQWVWRCHSCLMQEQEDEEYVPPELPPSLHPEE